MNLTYNDWKAVLEKAFSTPEEDGFISKRKLMKSTGLGEDAITRRINKGIDAGWIISERRMRECRVGPSQPIYVYKIDENRFNELFGG